MLGEKPVTWLFKIYAVTAELYERMSSLFALLTGLFFYKLRLALALLVERGFFLSTYIDPKSDLVNVERAVDRRRLE
jgi:hypothetical protein